MIGTALLWLLLRKLRLGEVLGTTAQLAAVIGVAAACDVIRDGHRAHRGDFHGARPGQSAGL